MSTRFLRLLAGWLRCNGDLLLIIITLSNQARCPPRLPPCVPLIEPYISFHTTTTTGTMAPATRRRPFLRLLPPSLFFLLALLVGPAAATATAAPPAVAAAATGRRDIGVRSLSSSLSRPTRWLLSIARRGGAIGPGESRGSGSWEQDLKVRGARGGREGGEARGD